MYSIRNIKIDNVYKIPLTTDNINSIYKKLIIDYVSMGAILGVKPQAISYYAYNKRNFVYLVQIDDRITWASKDKLKWLQAQVAYLLNREYEFIPTQHMLAYIPGKNYIKEIHNIAGQYNYIFQFDIKKYFDNITYPKIIKSLMELGYTEQGATIIAKLVTVDVKHAKKVELAQGVDKHRTVDFLQQGGVAAPVISNLIGYVMLDKPIMDFLSNNLTVPYAYYRYSDNVYILLKDPDTSIKSNPQEMYDLLKTNITNILNNNKFKAHKWSFISKHSPNRCMKMLGIVINTNPKLQNNEYESLISSAFNICVRPEKEKEIDKFIRKKHLSINPTSKIMGDYNVYLLDAVIQHLKGKNGYIKNINKKQYTQLSNLIKCLQFMQEHPSSEWDTLFTGDEWVNIVKQYKLPEKEFNATLKEVTV